MNAVFLGLALILVAAPAAASTLIGTTRARGCFDAATARNTGREPMRLCDLALQEEALAGRDRVATLVNRGILHMHARRTDAALGDFEAAILLDPALPEAWVNKGIALLRAGRDADAADAITKGLDLGPANPAVAYYSRAFAFEGIGRVRDAYEDFGRAAALAPDWPSPGEQLSRFKTVRVKTAGV
jgi:tetratricopeptide (TPR) repeat protein